MSDAIETALCETIDDLRADRNRWRKRARKLQDELNRVDNLIPGTSRLFNGDRIVMEMNAEAERLREEGVPHSDPDGLDRDALWLERLVYDLVTLREGRGRPVRGSGSRAKSPGKYDPSQWPRGPRP